MRTLFAVSALVLLGATTLPVASTAPVLEIHVAVTPTIYSHYQLLARPTPDTYTCSVTVSDPDKKYGLARAEVVAKPGVPAQVTKADGDYEVQFKVEISKADDIAQTKVVVKHAGAVIARQSSVVRLLKSADKGYRPAQ